MTSTTTTGTVKDGRWEYPATQLSDGHIIRNSKRDGSGHDVEVTPKVAETFTSSTPAASNGHSVLSPLDRAMLAQIGNTGDRSSKAPSFDFFDDGIVEGSGIWFAHASEQTANPPAARRAFKSLANKGYLEISEPQEYSGSEKDRWIVLTAKGAEAAIELAGQSTELPEFKAGHATGGGNQTKRPGKSTWKLGSPCPQGHKLSAQTLYTMPSGRNQCRECRGTMPSRELKGSKTK